MAKPSFKQSLLSGKAVEVHLLFGGLSLILSIELLNGNAPPDFGFALIFALVGYPIVLLLLWYSDRLEYRAKAEYLHGYLTAPGELLRKRRRWRTGSLAFLMALAIALIYFGGQGLHLEFIPAHYVSYGLFLFAVLGALGVNIWYGGPLDLRGDPPPDRE